jgi:circadian clock protein KaiC
MQKMINEFKPAAVIVDPVSNLNAVANNSNIKLMLSRLLDQLKLDRVTTVLTMLTQGSPATESTDIDISSLADTWIRLRDTEFGGERNRGMYILKSRGMAHSNQIREFVLTDKGVNLLVIQLNLERKRKAMEAQIADIRAEFKTEEAEVKKFIRQEKLRQQKVSQDREAMAQIRKAD